jgi:hypothetical protein
MGYYPRLPLTGTAGESPPTRGTPKAQHARKRSGIRDGGIVVGSGERSPDDPPKVLGGTEA